MRATDLPQDFYGAYLTAVNERRFASTGDRQPPDREAVAMVFGERSLVIEALTDTSELNLVLGSLAPESEDYELHDASADELFQSFVGKPLNNFWVAENGRGYNDLCVLGFGDAGGLLFLALNNVVSVMRVSGELLA